MESIIKIAAIAVAAALCAVVVKKHVPEIGIVVGLAAGAIILSISLSALKSAKEFIEAMGEIAGISPAVLVPVIKTTGISIITKLAAELCRDAKEGGVAAFLETAGAASALLVCLPLVETVLKMVTDLL